jgi:murein tripeptide amidase MpaA
LEERRKVWLIARQHPGETMAEWFVEGFLERLLDADDSVSRALLQQCVFYVVPHMNPDGAVHGNLRTNAVGSNLNREWATPSLDRGQPRCFGCAKR